MMIDPTELAALGSDAYLVDVREPDEFADARVANAVNIPLATLPDRLAELPADRPVYVMCLSGGRSAQAAAFLRNQGRDAVDVVGGITRWYRDGLPVVRDAA
jgi:rhodanese-related sulfurtransferase